VSTPSIGEVLATELRVAELERALHHRWLTVALPGLPVVELVPADQPAAPLDPALGLRYGFVAAPTPWFSGAPDDASHVTDLVEPSHLPWPDGGVALLACFDGFARLPGPGAFLDEAVRVLGEDGTFVAATRGWLDRHGLRGPEHPPELLLAQVEGRFAHTAVLEGRLALTALLLPEERAGAVEVALPRPPAVGLPGTTLVVASQQPLPELGPVAHADPALLDIWLAEVDRLAHLAHTAAAELAKQRVATSVEAQTLLMQRQQRPAVRLLGRGVRAARRWAAR
jgi:SAM-dependent methyltransferase